MSILWSTIAIVLGAGVLVLLHELGHFLVARALGIRVVRFTVGFGPEIYAWHAGADRVRCALRLLPLGGAVEMLDERSGPVAPGELSRVFTRVAPAKRIATILAGPLASFLVAVGLITLLLSCWGRREMKPVIGEVVPNSQAARAGLVPGQVIRAVDGVAVFDRAQAVERITDALSAGRKIALTVERGGHAQGHFPETEAVIKIREGAEDGGDRENRSLLEMSGFDLLLPSESLTVARVMSGGPAARGGLEAGDKIIALDGVPVMSREAFARVWRRVPGKSIAVSVQRGTRALTLPVWARSGSPAEALGARLSWRGAPARAFRQMRYGPLGALAEGVREALALSSFEARIGWRIVTFRGTLESLAGSSGDQALAGERSGAAGLVLFLAEISLSLALLNLLPLPALDGGQAVFELAQCVRQRVRSEARAHCAGGAAGVSESGSEPSSPRRRIKQ